MRSKFDQQLAALNQELTEMGATCAQAIGLAAQALEQQDVALAAPWGSSRSRRTSRSARSRPCA